MASRKKKVIKERAIPKNRRGRDSRTGGGRPPKTREESKRKK